MFLLSKAPVSGQGTVTISSSRRQGREFWEGWTEAMSLGSRRNLGGVLHRSQEVQGPGGRLGSGDGTSLRSTEQPRLEETLKDCLVQPFMVKRMQMRFSGTLSSHILKASSDEAPPHPWGGCSSDCFTVGNFLHQDGTSLGATSTCCPLFCPCDPCAE